MNSHSEKKEIKNCLHCRTTLFGYEFIYFDLLVPLSPEMLKGEKINFSIKRAIKKGEPFALYACRIRKKDVDSFLNVMERLESRILLSGHSSYVDYSQSQFRNILKNGINSK